jgi:transposase
LFALCPDHFRSIVARYRPRPAAEAYLRLRTLPGEQAGADWGHFGKITIGRAVRPLMGFVMVLSWSRQIFLRFYLSAVTANFLRGLVDAFSFFSSVPRVILYGARDGRRGRGHRHDRGHHQIGRAHV